MVKSAFRAKQNNGRGNYFLSVFSQKNDNLVVRLKTKKFFDKIIQRIRNENLAIDRFLINFIERFNVLKNSALNYFNFFVVPGLAD